MNHELTELRARVEMLERALASRHAAPGQFAGLHASFLCGLGALVALTATMVAVIFGLPVTAHGAGPTTVTAPFVIKDASGHVLVDVDVGPGGGQLRVFSKGGVLRGGFLVDSQDRGELSLVGGPSTTIVDSTGISLKEVYGKDVARLETRPDGSAEIRFSNSQGQPTATLGSQADATGALHLFGKAANKAQDWKVGLGVFGDHGVVTLNGLGQRALGLTGNGQIFGRSASGNEAMSLGVDSADQGYFSAKNTSGGVAAQLSVLADGTGALQVFKRGGELAAIAGTKDGTKGDVCANGPKAQVCLSFLAIKNFMQW